ncbi:MAG TPA: ferrous iron transport protein A [Clostridiaceae bacterium]|nr:ferrous iron transport protein A [Clostridiaceae bacterium]
MTLAELSPGQQANIVEVRGEGALRRRLLDMGLTPGTSLLMGNPAPSGDPLCIRIRSYVLSLRKEDAAFIEVDGVSTTGSPCGDCYRCSRAPRQERGRMRRGGRRARKRGAL